MVLAKAVKDVYIVAAKRTAFGAFGGALAAWSPRAMGVAASKAALDQCGLKPNDIQSVVFGNVLPHGADTAYAPRHMAIEMGIPIEVPNLGLNRLCGSGFQAVVTASQEIELGMADIVLAGGIENMSDVPYILNGIRQGTKLGSSLNLKDTLWEGLIDSNIKMPMGITAENLAEKYKITREECDKYAVQTQQRWAAANKAGIFKDEIAPVTVKGRKGKKEFSVDEHPREVSLEALAKLPPVFKKGGTVTAANASGVCDGAASLVLASKAAVEKHKLKPLARLTAYGIAGCDPKIMGIGPVPASHAALKAAGKKLSDVCQIEVNEAFAPQFLAVAKELGLDNDKTNIHGGAIALGHPLGTSGARITATLAHSIARGGAKVAMGSACIGGGQGITVLLEAA